MKHDYRFNDYLLKKTDKTGAKRSLNFRNIFKIYFCCTLVSSTAARRPSPAMKWYCYQKYRSCATVDLNRQSILCHLEWGKALERDKTMLA